MNRPLTRREFLPRAVLAANATTAALAAQTETAPIPRRVLGRTGVKVPILGMGGGSRLVSYRTDEAAEEALRLAFDLGITYMDTAHTYGNGRSETLVGRAIKSRRQEIFLASKMYERNGDAALRLFELSLKRLQTDHVDLLHVHKLETEEDLARVEAKGGVLEALYKLREQKAVRFIGITSHNFPGPLKTAIERHDFDCVQMALNAALQGMVKDSGGYKPDPTIKTSFEKVVLPVARKKNLGILAMKTLGQEHLIGDGPTKASAGMLLRYAWSLPVAAAVVGMPTPEMIRKNAALAREFTPMTEIEMKEFSSRIASVNKTALDRRFCWHADAC